jgi:predicted PurR-regulated permease PerM
MNTRISVVVRALFIAVCLLLILQGKPPVLAQRNEVISVKDETQDIELGKLSEFKTNQENWNSQNGQQIQALTARVDSLESNISSIEGWEKGGFGVLTALSILAMFFQLKRKGDKPQ